MGRRGVLVHARRREQGVGAICVIMPLEASTPTHQANMGSSQGCSCEVMLTLDAGFVVILIYTSSMTPPRINAELVAV
jgi:hypothetical protein